MFQPLLATNILYNAKGKNAIRMQVVSQATEIWTGASFIFIPK